jgi:hypothetical protein
MEVVRPRWSASSFLLYAGALVVLVAEVALLGWLSGDYGRGAFFGWAALVFVALAAVAGALRAGGDRVAAGLFALDSLIAFIVLVGAFLDLIGLDLGDNPISGFDVGRLLLYLVAMIAALSMIGRFRFPLLALVATGAGWLFVLDLISGGGDWSAVVAIFLGLFLVGLGAGVEPPYGFWVHVVAGLSIAGAFLYVWHSSNWEWILIAVVAVFLFLLAAGLSRSSYAVLSAILLFLAWAHFVENWLGGNSSVTSDYLPLGSEEDPFSNGGGGVDVWQRALLYGLYGVALVVVGLWLDRRRRTSEHRDELVVV